MPYDWSRSECPDDLQCTDDGHGSYRITGIPQRAGTYPFTVTVEDATGVRVSKRFVLVVDPPPSGNGTGNGTGPPPQPGCCNTYYVTNASRHTLYTATYDLICAFSCSCAYSRVTWPRNATRSVRKNSPLTLAGKRCGRGWICAGCYYRGSAITWQQACQVDINHDCRVVYDGQTLKDG